MRLVKKYRNYILYFNFAAAFVLSSIYIPIILLHMDNEHFWGLVIASCVITFTVVLLGNWYIKILASRDPNAYRQ
jgi:hypothetical protein